MTCFSFLNLSELQIPLKIIQPEMLVNAVQLARRGGGKIETPHGNLDVEISAGFGVAVISIAFEEMIAAHASLVWLPCVEDRAWLELVKTGKKMLGHAHFYSKGTSPTKPQLRP